MKQTQPPSLETVAHYFSAWRQNRASKKEPIPESLKKMAAGLKSRYPVGQIKTALNVNSNMLKAWSNDHSTPCSSPSFLSLPPEAAETVSDKASHTIKLEYPNGVRLTLTGEINNDMLLSLTHRLLVEVGQ